MAAVAPLVVFAPELLPGEAIQWSGSPNPNVIFHPDDSVLIPGSLVGGAIAVWLVTGSTTSGIFSNHSGRPFNWFGLIWGVPSILITQYVIWGRFFFARWRKRRTYYAITNRRVLISEPSLQGNKTTAIYFHKLTMIDKRVRPDGIGSISFGGQVPFQMRGEDSPPRPPTFEDVEQADAVYRLAMRMQGQSREPGR